MQPGRPHHTQKKKTLRRNLKMGYNGKWLDSFTVTIFNGEGRPQSKGKILLTTPAEDYFFTKEQWLEFKEKVNQI